MVVRRGRPLPLRLRQFAETMRARIVSAGDCAPLSAAGAWLRSRGLFDRGLDLVDEVVGVVRLDHCVITPPESTMSPDLANAHDRGRATHNDSAPRCFEPRRTGVPCVDDPSAYVPFGVPVGMSRCDVRYARLGASRQRLRGRECTSRNAVVTAGSRSQAETVTGRPGPRCRPLTPRWWRLPRYARRMLLRPARD